jgi:predicted DNA-binding transcriptional regulator AlpA
MDATMRDATSLPKSLELIQAHELRTMLGNVSDMWLWRRLREGDFPKPLMISKRRFWRRDEIAAYIELQSDQRTAASQGKAA